MTLRPWPAAATFEDMNLSITLARAVDVLGFLFGLSLIAAMLRLTFTLSTWPVRLLAAATAVYVAFRLIRVAGSVRRNRWRKTVVA